jgi:cytochrome c peroxidase
MPNGFGQQLNLTQTEVDAVIAFLKTLSGTDVYTNPKWSNPFPNLKKALVKCTAHKKF